MATRNNRPVPARAIHPGEILREELQARGIKQKDFAVLINMQASHLNAFINGKRHLNYDLAIKLEKQLGIPYKLWMDLQNGYMYDLRRIEEHSSATDHLATDGVDKPSIGDIIRMAAEEKGLSQRQLASQVGVSPSRISAFMTGRAEPSLRTAALLCTALSIPPAVMLGL